MSKVLVTDETKKTANIEKDKLAGKKVSTLNKAELDALITAICQLLKIADADGKIK
mgnify:CR=1 FL=1